jgi:hypothetical protein
MRGLLGVLFIGAVALTAGLLGFQAGIASNIGAAGGVIWLGGFPGLGFLFFLLFLGFLFFAIGGRRRAWAHGGRGPGWQGGPMGNPEDPRRQWMAEAHRRLHEEDAQTVAASPADALPRTDRPAAG